MLYRPREIAAELGIAPSTLRLWSVHFASELSDSARKASAEAPWARRRYTDEDLEILLQAKSLLDQGLTYQETKRRLRPSPSLPAVQPQDEVSRKEGVLPQETRDSLASLQEALKARDKTITTLRESLGFLDAYLQAVRQERDEARERARLMEKQLRELQADGEDSPALQRTGSWWRQVMRDL